MLEPAEQVQDRRIAASALDAQRSLTYGREADLWCQIRRYAILPADPVKPGSGKQYRIKALRFKLAQP
ncbi:hypothetical protein D3C86_2127170 [compost metagenome]